MPPSRISLLYYIFASPIRHSVHILTKVHPPIHLNVHTYNRGGARIRETTWNSLCEILRLARSSEMFLFLSVKPFVCEHVHQNNLEGSFPLISEAWYHEISNRKLDFSIFRFSFFPLCPRRSRHRIRSFSWDIYSFEKYSTFEKYSSSSWAHISANSWSTLSSDRFISAMFMRSWGPVRLARGSG